MLIKMGRNEVINHWQDLRTAAKGSLPPFAGSREDVLNKLLEKLLTGQTEAWAVQEWVPRKDGNKDAIDKGIVFTTVITDISTNQPSMLIYGMYGWTPWNKDLWVEGYTALTKYAKSRGCASISAYTRDDGLVETAKKFGIDTEWRYLVLEL